VLAIVGAIFTGSQVVRASVIAWIVVAVSDDYVNYFVNRDSHVSRISLYTRVANLRASSNLPVSYVLTGNLPEVYHIIYFLVISKYISIIALK